MMPIEMCMSYIVLITQSHHLLHSPVLTVLILPSVSPLPLHLLLRPLRAHWQSTLHSSPVPHTPYWPQHSARRTEAL